MYSELPLVRYSVYSNKYFPTDTMITLCLEQPASLSMTTLHKTRAFTSYVSLVMLQGNVFIWHIRVNRQASFSCFCIQIYEM